MQDLGDRVQPALKKLQALMPALNVPGKLHEGAGLWWSFVDLVKERKPAGGGKTWEKRATSGPAT
jgi:hypothetical protein